MAESTACTWKDDPVSDFSFGVFECSVDGHALNHSASHQHLLERTGGLTAQSSDAAAKLSMASGIGVTLCTQDT